jgi:hypothetical protein
MLKSVWNSKDRREAGVGKLRKYKYSGRPVRARTADLYRVNLSFLGFTTGFGIMALLLDWAVEVEGSVVRSG